MSEALGIALTTTSGSMLVAVVSAIVAYRGKHKEQSALDDAGMRDDTREYLLMLAADRRELREENAKLRLRIGEQDARIVERDAKISELQLQVTQLKISMEKLKRRVSSGDDSDA